MGEPEKKKEKKPLIKFGPFEQAIGVLLFMGWAANPSLPYALLSQPNPWSGAATNAFSGNAPPGSPTSGGIPLFTPPLMFLVIIAYLGYSILQRQEAERNRKKALAKAASKSSSSSSSSKSSSSSSSKSSSSSSSSGKAMSSSDVRAKGMPSSSSKHGDPSPKLVSGGGSGIDPKKDPSSMSFKKNYFLTMQGPGRPALVPFQDGLRPKAGEAEGTMWWDNVPDDAAQLMAPPVDPDKIRSLMKNPYAADMIGKDIELLKLKKRKKEEEERYEKVGSVLQTILGALLCAVDMRLGVAAMVFFLYRHFTLAQEKELDDEQQKLDDEKKDIMKRLSEAKKAGADKSLIMVLQDKLSKLG